MLINKCCPITVLTELLCFHDPFQAELKSLDLQKS